MTAAETKAVMELGLLNFKKQHNCGAEMARVESADGWEFFARYACGAKSLTWPGLGGPCWIRSCGEKEDTR